MSGEVLQLGNRQTAEIALSSSFVTPVLYHGSWKLHAVPMHNTQIAVRRSNWRQ